MAKAHNIQNAQVDGDTLFLTIDGADHKVNLCSQSTRLALASRSQRCHFIISSSGYGIHWPDIDEDLSIDGLIGIKHSAPLLEVSA